MYWLEFSFLIIVCWDMKLTSGRLTIVRFILITVAGTMFHFYCFLLGKTQGGDFT